MHEIADSIEQVIPPLYVSYFETYFPEQIV